MTSVMIIHDVELVRGALVAVLSNEPDLAVTAQARPNAGALASALAARPDVAVVHVERCDTEGLELPRQIRERVPDCAVLIVCGRHTPEALRQAVDSGIRGFLSADASPAALVDAVRRLAAGERVIEPLLLVAALRDGAGPLTARQLDVLRLASEGLGSREIAHRLYLSPGTVRNYLSAAIRQTGGRSLLEAVEWARREGWL
jgi:two-component system response regulator DesR